MATSRLTLTDTFQEVGTGIAVAWLQASYTADVHVGASAPAANAPTHSLSCNKVFQSDDIAALGGGIWVKGVGTLTYTTG